MAFSKGMQGSHEYNNIMCKTVMCQRDFVKVKDKIKNFHRKFNQNINKTGTIRK